MHVRFFIFHYLFDILTGVFENEIGAAGMVFNEIGHVVDIDTDSDIAGLGGVTFRDGGRGQCGKFGGRHCVGGGREE